MGRYRVNDIAAHKLELLGDVGRAWYDELDSTVAYFAHRWQFTPGPPIDGGSHSFVIEAARGSREPAVFKLSLPAMRGAGDPQKQLQVVVAAQQHGYVRVLAHDTARAAMLMERLGPVLDASGLSVEAQIDVICETLSPWAPAPVGLNLQTGAEKAAWLSRMIEEMWREVDRPFSQAAVAQAQEYAARRVRAHDAATAVLVHGDAHQHNLLLAGDGRYRLIDPDPMIAEPAADLSVPMRDWNRELLASGDPLGAVKARCRRISELTGVDQRAIWEWGYLERVSTALYCHTLGILEWSEPAYAVIEACVAAGPNP